MISKQSLVEQILRTTKYRPKEQAEAKACANIALVKYWGKRCTELNLPVTSSLSLSLNAGTHTKITLQNEDRVWLNGTEKTSDDVFYKRIFAYCDLFRKPNTFFHIETINEIPTAAGFASSSSGFAALILALNELLGWQLDSRSLSILARLGSGSSSRSIYSGFVEWHAGTQADGLDSYAEPLDVSWPDLCLGLWMISDKQKPIDSRQALERTVQTSPLYRTWPEKVEQDLTMIRKALQNRDFVTVGEVAESNALAMHATMMAASPPILYWLGQTVDAMQKVWHLRKEGLPIYFTMDAGPNLKLLYLKKDSQVIHNVLPIKEQ